jgi:glutathionylspermidine synthase
MNTENTNIETVLDKIANRIHGELLSNGPLFGGYDVVPWHVAPSLFKISEDQLKEIDVIGKAMFLFMKAANKLWNEDPEVRDLLNGSYPEYLTKFFDSSVLKDLLPISGRPDIVICNGNRLKIAEWETNIGGLGMFTKLSDAYQKTLPADDGYKHFPSSIARSLLSAMEERGYERIVFGSDRVFLEECNAYIPDLKQISMAINKIAGREISSVLMSKDDLKRSLHENVMIIRIWESINTTEDVTNEITEENAKNIYPPLRNIFEHKALMGLLHLPKYRKFWKEELGTWFNVLVDIIPKTWILKPGWTSEGMFESLKQRTKNERRFIIKSSNGYGSKGIMFGDQMNDQKWKAFIEEMQKGVPGGLMILQDFEESIKYSCIVVDRKKGAEQLKNLRIRLTPVFIQMNNEIKLTEIIATFRENKIVHGTSNGEKAVIIPSEIPIGLSII